MKFTLLALLIISTLGLNAQSTWIERLSYWPSNPVLYHDSVCGIVNASVGADGNLYLLGKTWQNDQFNLYKISQNGGAFLWSADMGYHSGLTWQIAGSLRATADSGCILYDNFYSDVNISFSSGAVKKYSSSGALQWTTNFFHDASIDYDFRNVHDVIQSSSGNYYVLLKDSLYMLDGSGTVISGTDAVSGANYGWVGIYGGYTEEMFELPGGDLLVRNDSSVIRTDLSGNVSWTYPSVNETDVVCFSSSAAFICEQGVQVTKIDASNGSVGWSTPISPSPVSSIDATSDGGVIIANGMQLRYSANQAMNGSLTKFDASGSQEWSKTFNLPHYGLSYVKQLPSGNYLTGGTYIPHRFDCAFDYNGLSAVVDSLGDGPLETASYLWPGDVDLNDTLDFATDGLLVGIAFGASGPARDHDNFPVYIQDPFDYVSDYGSDWSQTFGNGINYKYADFNGDGTIDNNDLNYWIGFGPWEIYCKESGASQTSTLPDFMLIPQSSTVLPGDTMRFYVVAGTAGTPINSVYDIASVLSLDYSLIDYSFGSVIAYTSDFGTPGINMFEYSNTNLLDANVMSILFSRGDHNDVTQLHDTLGVIELLSNSTISFPTVFHLDIAQFGAASYNTSPVEFNTTGASVLIDPNATSVQGFKNEVEIYPNPASQNLTVKTFSAGEKTFQVMDVPGKKLKSFKSSASVIRIPMENLESGTYFLMVSSDGQEKISKFVVQR